MAGHFLIADAARLPLADRSMALVIGSPPYEDCRQYGVKFNLKGQGWVDWMIPRVLEACRVSDGLAFFVMAGKVECFAYHPVVEWLVTDLTRHHGLAAAPSPYCYRRSGIMGSGGRHYHRRNWEPVYGFAYPDRLPLAWADNTATGHPPKYRPGGAPTHRRADGTRANGMRHTKRGPGEIEEQIYKPPPIANAGNVIDCKVGKGHIGDLLAHEGEAPYPERLVEFFIRSFARPGSTVLDPFSGSGTTVAVAARLGRHGIGVDNRPSQALLGKMRLDGYSVDDYREALAGRPIGGQTWSM